MEDHNRHNATLLTAGGALRHRLFNKITPILLSSALIRDSSTKDLIQDNCHAMVSLVEALIVEYGLDRKSESLDEG